MSRIVYPSFINTDKEKKVYREIYDKDNNDEDNLYNYFAYLYDINMNIISKYYKKAEKVYANFDKELLLMDTEAKSMVEIRKVAMERKKYKELSKLDWIIQYLKDKFDIDIVSLIVGMEDQDEWINNQLALYTSKPMSSPSPSRGSPIDISTEYVDMMRGTFQGAGFKKQKQASPLKKSKQELFKEYANKKIEQIQKYIEKLTPKNFNTKFFELTVLLKDLIEYYTIIKENKHDFMIYNAKITELINNILLKLENFQYGPRDKSIIEKNSRQLLELFKQLDVDVELEQTMNTDYDTVIVDILSEYDPISKTDKIRKAIIDNPEILPLLDEYPELQTYLRQLDY